MLVSLNENSHHLKISYFLLNLGLGKKNRVSVLTRRLLSRVYRMKRVSQTQQYNVTKQYYIMLAGPHVSTVPESSSGPQGTDPYIE
jgi:hypothetical protein